MGWIPRSKKKNNDGIALFMVVAAISVLAILVTEFTYIAQINQKMAFDSLDQVRAHYLAKSGFKISLLRLRAYLQVKELLQKQGAAAGGAIPRGVIEKIWDFPLFYPFPTLPGMSEIEKGRIESFLKKSGLEGKFFAKIDSESSRYNMNMVLAPFVPQPVDKTSKEDKSESNPSAKPSPSPTPTFSPEEAQKSLSDYLWQLFSQKSEKEPDFADENRNFRMDDFMDNYMAWVDPQYQRRGNGNQDVMAFKKAPFYTVSELRMIPLMSDELYDLFAPGLTASTTPGININTMKEPTLRAMFPNLTEEETKEFFKYRDSDEEDHSFKDEESFYKYVSTHFSAYQNTSVIEQLKADFSKRNIRIIVDETEFKITVTAEVNQSTRKIEAWVTLGKGKTKKKGESGDEITSNPYNPYSSSLPPANPGKESSGKEAGPSTQTGLNVTFMRFL